MKFLTLALILAPLAARAGDLVQYRSSGKDGKTASAMRLYLQPDFAKMEMMEKGAEPKHTMIFSKEKEESTVIDHEKKEYVVMDKATMEKMAARVGSAMGKMKEAFAKMPPEMRKMMEEKMKGMGGGSGDEPVTIKKVGSGGAVGKWTSSTHYEVTKGTKKLSDTWTVPMSEVGVDKKNFAVLKDMGKLYAGIGKQLGSLVGAAGAGSMDPQMWTKVEGVPVKTVSHGMGGDRTFELESAERKSFAASEFAVPAGYKKKEMPGGM